MISPKRICSQCRANATLNEKGEYSAISWKCPTCFRGFCRHVAAYKANGKDVCADCMIEYLDQKAIEKGNAA